MALGYKGKRDIQEFVDGGKRFGRGSTSLRGELGGGSTLGELPEPYRSQLVTLSDSGVISRVLFSHDTPIAWRTVNGMWIVPEVRYSVTTTNHQNVARVAIDNKGFYS